MNTFAEFAPESQKARIIIVDDEPAVLNILKLASPFDPFPKELADKLIERAKDNRGADPRGIPDRHRDHGRNAHVRIS